MFKIATSLVAQYLKPPSCRAANFSDEIWIHIHSMNHVFRTKPATIDDLKCIVNDFAENMDPNLIRKACSSARLWFEKLRNERSGHFKHLMLRFSFLAIFWLFLINLTLENKKCISIRYFSCLCLYSKVNFSGCKKRLLFDT